MNKKLAPELLDRLSTANLDHSLVSPSGREPKNISDWVGIIVEFNGDIKDLTDVGLEDYFFVQHPTKGYKIATGRISLDRLEDLAAIGHVVEIEGPRRMHQELDYSLDEINARVVHHPKPPETISRKGDGIVIGIIDKGFNWRHGTFINKKEDLSSRILKIWDQSLKAEPGESVPSRGPGVVYTQDQITDALNGKGNVKVRAGENDHENDKGGHGTHVGGIAAGNGVPGTCCHPAGGTYVGVAPDADLVVVILDDSDDLGENRNLNYAMEFIRDTAAQNNQPAVINISLGDNFGPHDGTSLVERTIDTLVAAGDTIGPRLFVVKSAGNEGKSNRHATGIVDGTKNKDVEFTFAKIESEEGKDSFSKKEKDRSVSLDLWYARANALNLTISDNHGNSYGPINHGTQEISGKIGSAVSFSVRGKINGEFDRDNNFRIKLNPLTSENLSGSWKINLSNPNANSALFHCWIETGADCSFLPPANGSNNIRASSDATLTVPGTSEQVITVSNHRSRSSFCTCSPTTGVAETSSRGPVAKHHDENKKPDIAAPGQNITSANAHAPNLRGDCFGCCHNACCCLYKSQDGTSQAAPHVTGAIALLLEENPLLTRNAIVELLKHKEGIPPKTKWDPAWGWGKLDVKAAIDEIRNRPHGGGSIRSRTQPQIGFGGSINKDTSTSDQLEDSGLNRLIRDQVTTSNHFPRGFLSWFRIVREKLKAFPEGEHVTAAVSRHFSEVRRLINTNRRVATMWHRAEGPRLLRLLLHESVDAKALAPNDVHTAALYLGRCFDLLTHYGSPRLRESLERYRSLVIALLAIPNCTPSNSTVGEGA